MIPKLSVIRGFVRARWRVLRLALAFYPVAAASVAINLFLIGLLLQALGLPAIPPRATIMIALPMGVPAAWAAASWIMGLVDSASVDKPRGRRGG